MDSTPFGGGAPPPPNKHSPPTFRPRDPSDLDTNPLNPSLPPLTDPATNYSGLSEIHDRTALVERTPTPPTALHHPNSTTDDIQWNGWSRDDTRHCVPPTPGFVKNAEHLHTRNSDDRECVIT